MQDGSEGSAHPAEGPDAGLVRYLRRLVTALTVTMIAGLLVLIALIVIRFREPPVAPVLPLPDAVTLPEGVRAMAFTQGAGWFAVVTDDDRILIFDRAGGTLRQTVEIAPAVPAQP
ncbi:MAG: DUF6476 family protein [Rhodobacteraceae bacterium]|jgi:hypothetical protein|nr:DUF6476 family protein [Paracoccaceae bacterium]